jgi:hypothetical protein
MPSGSDAQEPNVAMLGASTSGKTTFLAALSIALDRQELEWKVIGADNASTTVLINLTRSLTTNRTFPPPTDGIERYRWILTGPARKGRRRWYGPRRADRPMRISLDLADPSGEISEERVMQSLLPNLVDNLASSRGIIFLFDPIGEFQLGETYDYTFGIIKRLAQRMIDELDSAGRLPHYVAVCVSKFDEIRVFNTAEKMNFLVRSANDPYGFPRVDDGDARDFIAQLCRVSLSGNAELALSAIQKHFRPDRVKYYVSSAIGFYVDPRFDVYDPDDYQNQLENDDDAKEARIRGPIHPINVVEPVLWLSKQLIAGEEE